MNKLCKTCNEEKPLSEFHKRKDTPDGRKYYCKACSSKLAAEQRKRRPDLESARQKKYYYENRKKQIKKAAKWTKDNRSRVNRHKRITGKGAAANAKYNAKKKRQTPLWADHLAIKRIYAACARITKETGMEHHVDHIVPIQGRKVRGLHVEYNLQILPGSDNRSKGNRLV